MRKNQKGFVHLIPLLVVIAVVAGVGLVGWRVYHKSKSNNSSDVVHPASQSSTSLLDKAVIAGKTLSGNYCKGTGDGTFTHLPMNAADFSMLIPYGLTVGGHVSPIDHQYFQPTNFQSAVDTYPVYAMADAKIVDIEIHPPQNGAHGRIRLVFSVSCTFFYYYDLVTSVEPGIDAKQIPISVKAGQLIGHIGGQTLDFAVWNTKKPLTGFINPDSYKSEAWKIYTADPFPYYTPDLRKIVESKDPRSTDPIAGKIDYDVDGKLIGNWFQKDSGGYGGKIGSTDPRYFKTHLSFAPDLYDPSYFRISVGSLYAQQNQSNMQHVALTNSPQPQDVGVATGLVKYDLVGWSYTKGDGSMWDQLAYATGVKLKPQTNSIFGCTLVHMTSTRELKSETFVGKQCAAVTAFDSSAIVYTR